MTNSQTIKSKKRVADHGEVFTSEREVNAMLDLVNNETERIDSRFLEPACGTGNFLVPILLRKLEIVKKRYSKSQLEFERHAAIAVSSVYGVDILEDNVIHCRERLLSIFSDMYKKLYKNKCKKNCLEAVSFILCKNILHGDALSLKTVGTESHPIVFSEWTLVTGSQIKRRDFSFADILANESAKVGLFVDSNLNDPNKPIFISTPVKEFPLCNFLEIQYENKK